MNLDKANPTHAHPSKKNKFEGEFNKFLGCEVTVKDMAGNEYTGTCRGISTPHMNVIIMTKHAKVLVKNIASITRPRGLEAEDDE